MKKSIIKTKNLSKTYKLKGKNKTIQALRDINISIDEGEIFGLLGPNGAGKTTLIKILSTITQPTKGSAYVDGYDVVKNPKKVKPLIGLMLGSEMLYYRITGYDNLKFFCKVYRVKNYKKKIEKISEEFGINGWLDQYVGKFSSGMKMKLALCKTLLLNRKILFLDEPTLGLDVKSVDFVVNRLKQLNKTILISSHDMSVVERLCNRVAFINEGEIIKTGNQEELKILHNNEVHVQIHVSNKKNKLKSELEAQNYIKNILYKNNRLEFILNERKNFNDLLQILRNYNLMIINEKKLSLEELFLQLIK